ncbi:hypothetical protein [Glutamicibacter sp. JC586]|uniref:hypothetical protein n=1 Tax=Glutamicibacter sp. JC586 TaxID=2590552 RepID=UPI00135C0FAF|nr:hypothetical protein [Glutamicibacter sp. JC586]
MFWIAWSSLGFATVLSCLAAYSGANVGTRVGRREILVAIAGVLAIASAVVAAIANVSALGANVPLFYVVVLSSVFAISFGGPFTELVFRLAAKNDSSLVKDESDPSPLRGGLWIGLLERAAILGSLWASWPEGIAIVMAIKGLGRFSELKDHRAAEQFILGTFASGLIAAGSYGLGLLLL